MTQINGMNGADSIARTNMPTPGESAQVSEQANLSQELQKGLQGNGKQEVKGEIKPKEPTDEELLAKNEKMSRKDAKKWVKNYVNMNGCTKEEAKKAFEKEFGYEYPKASQTVAKITRETLVLSTTVGVLSLVTDRLTGGKLGVRNFIQNGHFKDKEI